MNLANLWRACCPAWEGVQFVELQVDLSLSHFVYPEFSLAWPAWVLFFIVILLVWHETSQVWITEPKFMKNPMMSNVWGLALAIFTLFWMLHVLKDCVRCNVRCNDASTQDCKGWNCPGAIPLQLIHAPLAGCRRYNSYDYSMFAGYFKSSQRTG